MGEEFQVLSRRTLAGRGGWTSRPRPFAGRPREPLARAGRRCASRPVRAVALAFLGTALACGSTNGRSPPLGAPMTGLAPGTWTWVGFEDSSCSDGSPTGIGVNPGEGPDLLFFLDGGGACASAETCFVLHTATLGPFGEGEFEARVAESPGSILDRNLAGNPFADATLVYVPYCTGDVHGGDRVVTYTDGPGGTMHHTGHLNILAFLARVAATYPAPRRLVVTGSSAGGFGTLVNYQTFRSYFPGAEGFLVDDSGPPLESNGGPLIQAGFASWGIADVLDPLCGGPGLCEADLSKGLLALLRKYPSDRFGLLSWNADPTISAYYGISVSTFTSDLTALVSDVLAPSANGRAFVAVGSTHTMLGDPGSVAQNGVGLLPWLGAEVGGSAGFASETP